MDSGTSSQLSTRGLQILLQVTNISSVSGSPKGQHLHLITLLNNSAQDPWTYLRELISYPR